MVARESDTGVGETDGGDASAWHDSKDDWDQNLTWRHGMIQALGLPLHEVITKSRVINSGWNFMLIICACTV